MHILFPLAGTDLGEKKKKRFSKLNIRVFLEDKNVPNFPSNMLEPQNNNKQKPETCYLLVYETYVNVLMI